MQTGGPGSPGRKKHDKNAMFASAGPHRLSRSRGIILSWDPVTRHGDSAVKVEGPTLKITRPPVEEIEALGFRRDEELEDHLRLFAGTVLLFTRCVAVAALRPPPTLRGIGLRAYLSQTLFAFRSRSGPSKRWPAGRCHLQPKRPNHLCAPLLTFGRGPEK